MRAGAEESAVMAAVSSHQPRVSWAEVRVRRSGTVVAGGSSSGAPVPGPTLSHNTITAPPHHTQNTRQEQQSDRLQCPSNLKIDPEVGVLSSELEF